MLLIILRCLENSRSFHSVSFLQLITNYSSRLFNSGMCFGLAFLISGVTANQLWVRRERVSKIVISSALVSIILRISMAPIVIGFAVLMSPEAVRSSSSGISSTVAANAELLHSPIQAIFGYGFMALVIGFTEEMWRAGSLAALAKLYPAMFENRWMSLVPIGLVAMVFAVAHLDQLVVGVAGAFVFGIGQGLILVFRKSYWEAAVSHSLFDATLFFVYMAVTK